MVAPPKLSLWSCSAIVLTLKLLPGLASAAGPFGIASADILYLK
jgi:hypothetical protein